MPPSTKPLLRQAGRVLVIDRENRILLLRVKTVGASEPVLWLTPGGGCEFTRSRFSSFGSHRSPNGTRITSAATGLGIELVWRLMHSLNSVIAPARRYSPSATSSYHCLAATERLGGGPLELVLRFVIETHRLGIDREPSHLDSRAP